MKLERVSSYVRKITRTRSRHRKALSARQFVQHSTSCFTQEPMLTSARPLVSHHLKQTNKETRATVLQHNQNTGVTAHDSSRYFVFRPSRVTLDRQTSLLGLVWSVWHHFRNFRPLPYVVSASAHVVLLNQGELKHPTSSLMVSRLTGGTRWCVTGTPKRALGPEQL